MITDHLIPLLKERLPNQPFGFGRPPDPIAVLANPDAGLGELAICDDDEEATVFFAGAHCHFECWVDSLSQEDKERRIAESVVSFMESVLKDEVVFMTSFPLFGGVSCLRPGRKPRKSSWFVRRVVWSGEVK